MLNLITLGGLTVRGSNSPLDTSSIRKPLALLAVVAAAGESGVSRDRLQAFFWPESDADRARGGLKQAQYLVRQSLGVDPFSAQGSNVALEPKVMVADIAQFQERFKAGALVEAAGLYRGPFLEGVYLKDVPEFEEWVDAERARLAAVYARALERLAEQAAEHHDLDAAADWWRRRAALDRLDGRVAHHYMKALAAGGDLEGAIRHARVHTELVRSELGAEPSPEFLTFAEQLRASPAEASRQAGSVQPGGPRQAAAQPRQAVLAAAQSEDRPELPSPTGAIPEYSRGGSGRWRRTVMRIAGVGGIAILVGLVAWQQSATTAAARINDFVAVRAGKIPPSPAPSAAPARLNDPEPSRNIGRVLVAPLVNESHDTSAATFGRLAADWMATGLAQTGLVDVVDAQTAAGLGFAQSDTGAASPSDLYRLATDAEAKTLVVGRYYITRDSLLVQVMIEDAKSAQLVRTLPRIAVRAGDYSTALALLRERIGGAFATLVDPRLESIVDRSTPAPSLTAYQAYAEGLDCYIRGSLGIGQQWMPTECSPAASFQAAIRADSSWTLPYIWLMYTHAGNSAARDSLIGILDRRHEVLSELDRYGLEYFKRRRAGDDEGELTATRRASALAPRSNWTYQAAMAAYHLGRYEESLTFLRQLDPEHGWVRGWWPYFVAVAGNEASLGDYRAMLSDAEKAEKRNPGTSLYVSFRLMALAALGDSATVVRVVDSLIAEPPVPERGRGPARLAVILNTLVSSTAMVGHPQLARHIADRCLATLDPAAISTAAQHIELLVRAECLYFEGRWIDAKAALERLLTAPPAPGNTVDSADVERKLVNVETRLGDSASAAVRMANVLARSNAADRVADSTMMLAHVAAIHGMKARAVDLLRQLPISRRGLGHPDFLSLRTYPPFRALIAPGLVGGRSRDE